jgi:hypothetical protein
MDDLRFRGHYLEKVSGMGVPYSAGTGNPPGAMAFYGAAVIRARWMRPGIAR